MRNREGLGLAAVIVVALSAGCGAMDSESRPEPTPTATVGQALHSVDQIAPEELDAAGVLLPDGSYEDEDPSLTSHQFFGKVLFNFATFKGNGRTCASCHPSGNGQSGTLSPADIRARFAARPKDPLFKWDAADTLGGKTFERLLEHATILVEIPLPSNVRIAGSSARSVVLRRGIPTTMNTPALDPVLMYDGRAPNLQEQARGAIAGHAQSTKVSAHQLDAIADFETTLFSRANLRSYASGGRAPSLPLGNTLSEQRGGVLFRHPMCSNCHSGPMLNETTAVEMAPIFSGPDTPPGSRFPATIRVADFNVLGNPVYDFEFTNPDGTVTTVRSPDPGLALISGRVQDVGRVKTPILWGVKDTAPYFHDNSAKTLEDVMKHYDRFFREATGGVVSLSAQDQADLVAYLKLL